MKKSERNEEIYQMRMDGKTYAEIAEHFGISVGRVDVILTSYRQQLLMEEAKKDTEDRR